MLAVGSGQSGTLSGTSTLELDLVAAAVVLGVALLVIRAIRSAGVRRRRAAGSAYFDRDAAHYGPTGLTASHTGDPVSRLGASSNARRRAGEPMAPTFAAPRAGTRSPHAAQPPAAVAPVTRTPTSPGAVPLHSTTLATPTAVPVAPGTGVPRPADGPSMAEPPVADPGSGWSEPAVAHPVPGPLPSLRPRGVRPPDLPAMPPPPPSDRPSSPARPG